MDETSSSDSQFNGWHIVAALLLAVTALDLIATPYFIVRPVGPVPVEFKCGTGYYVITAKTSVACTEENRGIVMLRMVVGAGLAAAAYQAANRKAKRDRDGSAKVSKHVDSTSVATLPVSRARAAPYAVRAEDVRPHNSHGGASNARSCPCGCGRQIGFTRRGAAAGYVRTKAVSVRLTAVSGLALQKLSLPPYEAGVLERSPVQAQNVADSLLEHCHGTANAETTLDQLSLMRMVQTLEALADMAESAVGR